MQTKKICTKCKKELSIENFVKNKTTNDGYVYECKNCRKIYHQEYYKKNSNTICNRTKIRRDKLRQWLIDYKKDKICSQCGENHPACLQFHHLNKKTKDRNIAYAAYSYGWNIDKLLKEINKCIILCANCHFKLHYNEKK